MSIIVDEEDHFGVESFSLRNLQFATGRFSNKNIIGRGEFCFVYKGRLADGSLVAVKTYTRKVMIKEQLEITRNIVAHRNVIDLRGFCITEKGILLVYPYMANGSVESFLRRRKPPLEWAIRRRIAVDVARGIAHLHHGCKRPIIHFQIEASNILLDESFQPVLAGFSLSKLMINNDDNGRIKLIQGKIGLMAPECLSSGMCSLKADVYGYGMFLLELVSGGRLMDLARLANANRTLLLDWVKKLLEEKKFMEMVDRELKGKYKEENVEKLMQVAAICTQANPNRRPTMSEVMMMLEDGHRLTKTWEEFLQNISSLPLRNAKWIEDIQKLNSDI